MAAAGVNPATPVSASATVAQSSASNAPASSSAAAAAASSSSAAGSASSVQASSSAQASSSVPASSAAASSASSAPVSSSSAAAASSSSLAASSASSSSSVSRSSSSSTATVVPAGASSSSSGSSGLSGGAIGGIVGGVVGGLVLVGLLWMLLRRRKDKKNRVAPPPPRDFRDMTFNSTNRPRMGSNNMMSQAGRASSYATLIHPGRPSSQAPRSPSYYATYPIATPSTLPDSPPMPASLNGDSPPLVAGQYSSSHAPGLKPALAPIDTGLVRDNSSSSGEREFGVLPKHKSSVDRLRYEGGGGPGSDRAPSPSSTSGGGGAYRPGGSGSDGDPSSRTTSPHPSMNGHVTYPRHSFSPDGARYPRPPSMTSMSTYSQSGRYLKPNGAPHAGRNVAIEMPKPLGARPDSSGDFFWQTPKIQSQAFDVGFDGHNRRMSRAATELDFHSLPNGGGHSRMPSSQSTTTVKSNINARSPGPSNLSADKQPSHSRSMQSMRGSQR